MMLRAVKYWGSSIIRVKKRNASARSIIPGLYWKLFSPVLGIKRLTIAYKQTVSKFGNLTTENGVIWKNVREFVSILASQEEKFFREEHLIRDKQAKSIRNGRPGEDPVTASLLNIPLKRRHKEEYINPFEAGWRERY